MIIEDCDVVLRFVHTLLAPLGSRILEATCCGEALTVAAMISHLDILIADITLPDGLGTSVVIVLKERFPLLKIIFTSGAPLADCPEQAREEIASLPIDSWQWVTQPFNAAMFSSLVEQLLKSVVSPA